MAFRKALSLRQRLPSVGELSSGARLRGCPPRREKTYEDHRRYDGRRQRPPGRAGRRGCCREGIRRPAHRRGRRGPCPQDRRRQQHLSGRHRAGELH